MGDEKMHLEVDGELCTDCGLCEERAPENLVMKPDGGGARVIKQPTGESERASCTEAVDYCPSGGLTIASPKAEESAA